MKNTITEMKNTLEGIDSRPRDKEECISDLEDRMEIIQSEQQKGKKNSLRDLWDNIKHPNIPIIGVSKGEERKELTRYLRYG